MIHAFVLALNEEANIANCLQALTSNHINVIVLDSGSTDRTREISAGFSCAQVETYQYIDHCSAYNTICTQRVSTDDYALILDADMVVSARLVEELASAMRDGVLVVTAPIEMWWEGERMRGGSLCPPKPILFRGGVNYFVASGHGERLLCDPYYIRRTSVPLIHDDRKGFSAYLNSQLRYARATINRSHQGECTLKDMIYLHTPFVMLFQPLYSYILKGGFRSGRAGLIYALDRLIAASIMLRESISVGRGRTGLSNRK